jgi:hypothetical protein
VLNCVSLRYWILYRLIVNASTDLLILLLLLGELADEAEYLVVEVLHATSELVPIDILVLEIARRLLHLYLFLKRLTLEKKVAQFLEYHAVFLSVLQLLFLIYQIYF